MKIENDLLASGVIPRTNTETKPTGPDTFAEKLGVFLNKPTNDSNFEGVLSPTINKITNDINTSDSKNKNSLFNGLDEILGLLDEYSSALGSQSVSLKQLAPLAVKLDRQVDQFEQNLQTTGDNGLDTLTAEILTQAKVAVLKFHRGDYV